MAVSKAASEVAFIFNLTSLLVKGNGLTLT